MRISFRKVVLAFVVLGSMTLGVTALRNSHSIAAFEEKRHQIDQLEKENEKLQREIVSRQTRLTNLQQNPDELKLEIERRLKLVTPGTKQFILQDGTKVDGTNADGSPEAGSNADPTQAPPADSPRQ
jgi:cell division protein FtsB